MIQDYHQKESHAKQICKNTELHVSYHSEREKVNDTAILKSPAQGLKGANQ